MDDYTWYMWVGTGARIVIAMAILLGLVVWGRIITMLLRFVVQNQKTILDKINRL